MKKILSLVLFVAILAGGPLALLHYDPLLALDLWPVDPLDLLWDPEQAFTFEGAMAIAERLDRIADELEMPPLPTDSQGLFMLMAEIIPYYHYEGTTDKLYLPAIRWAYFPGDAFFHVLGRCQVGEGAFITINLRYANWWSSWYGRRSLLATVVHEVGHSQGIYLLWSPLSEPTTQTATLEVLAAMTRDANPWALPAFIRELEGYAVDYAWSKALAQDRMEEFGAFLGRLDPGIYSKAKFDRALSHWADNMDRLRRILKNYGEVPYVLVVSALNAGGYQTQKLAPLPNSSRRIALNDTAWTLQHIYQMAREYDELLERFEQEE